MSVKPRRLPTTQAEAERNLAVQATPGLRQGVSKQPRPTVKSAASLRSVAASTVNPDRVALVTGFTSGDYGSLTFPDARVYLSALPSGADWGIDEDAGGAISYDNDGGIYFHEAGVYCVTLILNIDNIQAADPDCSIRFFCDTDDGFSSGFSVMARGGDARVSHSDLPAASRTYFNPGEGLAAGYFLGFQYHNFDTVNITDVGALVQVQRVA